MTSRQFEIQELKKLFIIDALGAGLSAFMLGFVLVRLETYFGIPLSALYLLAAIPCFFMIYDLYAYFKVKSKLPLFLKGIAIANLLYCLMSLMLAVFHMNSLTPLGWLYLVGEIIIIVCLSLYELKVASA